VFQFFNFSLIFATRSHEVLYQFILCFVGTVLNHKLFESTARSKRSLSSKRGGLREVPGGSRGHF